MASYNYSLAAQEFYNHAPSIWIRHPKTCSSTSSLSSEQRTIHNTPILILPFSWTGASPGPFSKYTAECISMFPNAPIILITTTLSDLIFRSSQHKQSILFPAIDYITSRHLDSAIHIQCFSEGGSHKAIEFAKTYLSASGSRQPLTSLCLDSTPGSHQYHRLSHAFALSLHPTASIQLPPSNYLLRTFGLLFAYLLLSLFWCFYILYGPKKNIMTRIRRGLEDQRLWDTWHVSRCYLYSEKDRLIKWQDVERHAAKAGKRGVRVLKVRFRGSEHCCHVKEDRERYWRGIRWALGIGEGDGVDEVGVEGAQDKKNVEIEMETKNEKESSVAATAPAGPVASTRELTIRPP